VSAVQLGRTYAGSRRSARPPLCGFCPFGGRVQPRFILFENVRGLVTAKTADGSTGGALKLIQRSFEDIGYACRFRLLNAADYGAPQRRVRLFMIASCAEVLPEFPAASHSRFEQHDLLTNLRPWTTLGEFLARVPDPDPEECHFSPA
jgi:DNA (cytosine-5)-methyltransferase 1